MADDTAYMFYDCTQGKTPPEKTAEEQWNTLQLPPQHDGLPSQNLADVRRNRSLLRTQELFKEMGFLNPSVNFF